MARSIVVHPNRASTFTYDAWARLARAEMLVSEYIRGGSWSRDEIVTMVSNDTGLPEGTIQWMLV